jgi:hypothetical protein
VFDSVVAGAFQITFRANDVFSFFKNYFWHQHIKTIQNIQTILNFSKKKKIQNFWERSRSRVPKRNLNPCWLRSSLFCSIYLLLSRAKFVLFEMVFKLNSFMILSLFNFLFLSNLILIFFIANFFYFGQIFFPSIHL